MVTNKLSKLLDLYIYLYNKLLLYNYYIVYFQTHNGTKSITQYQLHRTLIMHIIT